MNRLRQPGAGFDMSQVLPCSAGCRSSAGYRPLNRTIQHRIPQKSLIQQLPDCVSAKAIHFEQIVRTKCPLRVLKTIDMNSGTIQSRSQRQPERWFCETRVSGVQNATFRDNTVNGSGCRKYMLWIDGVGAWQLCVGESFVVGAPSLDHTSADIALLANVSRKHATLHRDATDWRLQAHQSASISGRTVTDSGALRSGDQICLGERVKLGFRIPSALSSSAVIDFESDHRPSHSVDGIILLSDHCLLGPRRDHHVWCSQWTDMVVLFNQDGELRCRSKAAVLIDGIPVSDSGVLRHGSMVTGEELRFRVEQIG